MTMISKVDTVNCTARPLNEEGETPDIIALELGVPRITGTFLIDKDKVKLISPKGETLIIAHPFRVNNQILVHFAFGGVERRVGHTITVAGLRRIVRELTTILDIAELEEG